MELKDYQRRSLKEIEVYLDTLNTAHEKKRKFAEVDPDYHFDVPLEAWKQLGLKIPYKPWQNGLGEDTPAICIKIPTGGGKTFLATKAVEQINLLYRKIQAGFVLWIVPSSEIYRQTLSSLRNREHPYRQALDLASGGKTLVLEKTDRFTPQQAQEHLVVMLLMLPSANRQDKETLKVFQDSAGYEAFFPAEDNIDEQSALLKRVRNLDHYLATDSWQGVMLKTSLGNTLRVIRPLIVLDEGHKAYSDIARETIRTFNPCFVLELSATPHQDSNVLVSISGQELNREEMIKLDLNIVRKASNDWRDTLLSGFEQIKQLDAAAETYRANGGRYIRPICLIQVERTGKKQDIGHFIHANDARKYLIEKCNVRPDQIRIKSAENDGLENVDLLDENCPIQYIITRSALQEGWDCPFAYVLIVLTNPTSKSGITQLVGRVLRQPYAKKTNVKVLDESYVYCYQQRAKELLRAVQRSFEEEGLGDLKHHVRQYAEIEDAGYEEIRYRPQFRKFESKIYLPRFVMQEEQEFRDVNYEADILSRIDWGLVDLAPIKNVTLGALAEVDQKMRVGLSNEPLHVIASHDAGETPAVLSIDLVFITQQLLDIVPNPWIAYQFAANTIQMFLEQETYERVANDLVLIIGQLKQHLAKARDTLAAQVFSELLAEKRLVFFLQAISSYVLPSSLQMRAGAPQLIRDNNSPIQLSLFEHFAEEEFNETEKSVAIYLDKQTTLLWWYRNMVGAQGYKIKGWQKNNIYADFVAAQKDPKDENDYSRVFVLETKGLHLKGNADTEYKKNIFALCNKLGRETDWQTLGEEFGQKSVEFQIIFEDEWQSKINELLKF